ncbi:MAG: hypothetical protein JSS89_03530 [Bacteroidetes bacterium]|nr:hypothetical protein [Bacteroidota bacterium]
MMNLSTAATLISFMLTLFAMSTVEVTAQTVAMLTSCEQGISFMSNAAASSDGRAVIVGDLGRIGTIGMTDSTFTWECLPEQPFLFDAWISNDSLIVVGANGAVWWRAGGGSWKNVSIPDGATCRSVEKFGREFYVGTESGGIWRTEDIRSGVWTKDYTTDSSVLDMCAHDSTLVAVGTNGGLFVKSASGVNWVDRSSPEVEAKYSSVRIAGPYFIVGADSGRVMRIDRQQFTMFTSQVFAPSRYSEMPDFRGRADRILSSCFTSDGLLVVSGYFYDGPLPAVGVFVSADTGRTWARRAFYDQITKPSVVNAEYAPLVFATDSVLSVIAGTLGSAIVRYSSTDHGVHWKSVQATNFFQRFDVPGDSVPHYQVGALTGIVIQRESSEYLTTECTFPTQYEDLSLITAETIVRQWKRTNTIDVNGTVVSRLPGRFYYLLEWAGRLSLRGDSNRIAISSNNGRSWEVSTLDLGVMTVPSSLAFLGEDLLAIGYNRLYHRLSNSSTWSHVLLQGPLEEQRYPTGAIQVNDQEVALLVNVRRDTLFVRTDLYIATTSGDTVKLDSLCTIPSEAMNTPSLFMSGDTISMMMPVRSTNGPGARMMRCVYTSNVWQCDTARFEVAPDRKIPLNVSDLALTDLESRLIGLRFGGGMLQSTDDGRTWTTIPSVQTGFSGSMIAAASKGSELVLVGSKYYFASIQAKNATDVPQRSDEPTTSKRIELSCDPFVDGVVGRMTVFTALGTIIQEVDGIPEDVYRTKLNELPDGLYNIHLKGTHCTTVLTALQCGGTLFHTTTSTSRLQAP